MNKNTFFVLLILNMLGCAGIPNVDVSQLQVSDSDKETEIGSDGSQYLASLMARMRGTQFGDRLFKRSTKVYWLVPEVHEIDLKLTAREENMSQQEYQRRLDKLREIHQEYLIFSIDLRMPLIAKWTKDELIDFLKTNLVITLDVGSKKETVPENTTYRTIERFEEQEVQDLLSGSKNIEVSIPLRVSFNKRTAKGDLITPSTNRVILKLRLKEPPPFNIGDFDARAFQGFLWKVTHKKKAPSIRQGPGGRKK
ncbi:MAG: hypothetical protein ACE5HO_11505 [bacterium]